MITIPNKEAARSLKDEAQALDGMLGRANKYINSLSTLREFVENPASYAFSQLVRKFPDVKKLGLSFPKLCELYEIPFADMQEVSNALRGSQYLEFVEYNERLGLDWKAVDAFIEQEAVIVLTKPQEAAYKAAEKMAKELNKLQAELDKVGATSVPLGNIVQRNLNRVWAPSPHYILMSISRRL